MGSYRTPGQQKSDGDGVVQFVQYARVTTNELEGGFRLTDDSSRKLARCGLHANAIEGISKYSRRKNPTKIIAIVKNTQRCYDSLKSIIKCDKKAGASFFKQMHRHQLLEELVRTRKEP